MQVNAITRIYRFYGKRDFNGLDVRGYCVKACTSNPYNTLCTTAMRTNGGRADLLCSRTRNDEVARVCMSKNKEYGQDRSRRWGRETVRQREATTACTSNVFIHLFQHAIDALYVCLGVCVYLRVWLFLCLCVFACLVFVCICVSGCFSRCVECTVDEIVWHAHTHTKLTRAE